MTTEDEKRERINAENTANTLMPKRLQSPYKSLNESETIERLNRIECFLVEKHGFNPDDQSIMEGQRRTIHAKLTERELEITAHRKKTLKEEDAAVERLIRANFGFFSIDGERLDPDSRFKDTATGEETDTLWNLTFPPAFRIGDSLALTDARRFVMEMSEKLERRGFIETAIDRHAVNIDYKHDISESERFARFKFSVSLVHLPPRTKT